MLDELEGNGLGTRERAEFLASQFNGSDEFRDLYGADPTHHEYIDAMYHNVLGREPDLPGFLFWVGGMDSGLTRDDILIAFTESDENVDKNSANIDDGVWVV